MAQQNNQSAARNNSNLIYQQAQITFGNEAINQPIKYTLDWISSKRTPKEIKKKFEKLKNVGYLKFPNDPNLYHISSLIGKKIISQEHRVELYYHQPTNMEVVLKFLLLPKKEENTESDYAKKLDELYKEIETHRVVSSHTNIVDFYGFCFRERYLIICMEKMDGSLVDLYKTFHWDIRRFPEELLGTIAVSIIDALIALRKAKITHRDIKPGNILYKLDGDIKVADFGCARILENSITSSYSGTEIYMPPEMFEYPLSCNSSRDVWSLGITLIELAYGQTPYERDLNDKYFRPQIPKLVQKTNNKELLEKCFKKRKLSAITEEFLLTCLERDPSKRSRPEDLVKTNFYKYFLPNTKKEYISRCLNYTQVNRIETSNRHFC